MKRREMVLLIGVATLVLGVSMAWAGDVTQASGVLDQIATSSLAWLNRGTVIGFVLAVLGVILQHFTDIKSFVGIPVYYVIVVGLVVFMVGALQQGAAAGATPQQVSAPGVIQQ